MALVTRKTRGARKIANLTDLNERVKMDYLIFKSDLDIDIAKFLFNYIYIFCSKTCQYDFSY